MNIFLDNFYNLSLFFNTEIGIFVFVCIYILVVLLILPSSWMSLLSGFLYGSYLGSIIVFISAFIGAILAFFISKSFFAKKLKNLFSRYPKLSVMEQVVKKGGLKLIFLARLSPIFPFGMLNYFYGLNKVKFRDFTIGLLGIIPATFLYCSVGSLAKTIQELKNVQSTNNLYMTIIGVVSTFLVVYFLAKYSREYFENS
ncbi:TVP38/TMEM64 family protein [Prochlorococcus marinus XMU1410]|uniref:TVP38/TMEM64 family protein n=1 Tax=Prochlorococcus marinus TaxID=1219 RepID=UPI001ADB605D|nr:VTT domain-containing protein [Prochlorococcus marinus]MBO8242822.1 TVP38/TMEM64 family protein [Prochlorococcus marinus XMU1410]MBW3053943.1 TVP38/TMEM64 family protein [Prochlorococcus marinus str. MU1410]